MSYKGEGYSVGPGYEVKGPMVFDVVDGGKTFSFLIREDKAYELELDQRRRENAVRLSEAEARVFAEWFARRLGLLKGRTAGGQAPPSP